MIPIDTLVENALWDKASDLHLVPGLVPRCRVDGQVREMKCDPLTVEECECYALELAEGDYNQARAVGEASRSVTIAGIWCRVNLFRQQGAWSIAIRLLGERVPELSKLGLPKAAAQLAGLRRGLVLVAGEGGSGRSTTLAAFLDRINHTRAGHILSLEDPIEYIHVSDRCVVNQREVGRDTGSFTTGVRAALREDSDVLFLGDLWEAEAVEAVLTAAETGRLVLAAVQAGTAVGAVERLIDAFPVQDQQQLRQRLSLQLKAVLCQRLLPKTGGGRALACELMWVDGAIRALIQKGRAVQMDQAIQDDGIASISMERALADLLRAGTISSETYEQALSDGLAEQAAGRVKAGRPG